jgi:hypothetical protein
MAMAGGVDMSGKIENELHGTSPHLQDRIIMSQPFYDVCPARAKKQLEDGLKQDRTFALRPKKVFRMAAFGC